MHATFIHMRDPFRPNVNRDAKPLVPGRRIRTYLKQHGLVNINTGKRIAPYVVMLNGKPVLEKKWGTVVRDQDVLTVSNLPRGGQGGSNPLQIVAMIALIIVAIYAPYAVPGLAGTMQGSLLSAAIMFGGGMLLNMLFAPTGPSVSQSTRGTTSPTYTLSAQGNSARLMEAIPVLYGRYRIYPDFAAAPYTEVRGTDQYLYQLFCISQGDIAIEKVQLEDTDISNFPDVQYEIVPPNARLTLFPSNVATSISVDNLTMYGPNQPGYAILGPFTINAADTQCNSIGVDVALPNGAFTVNDQGSMNAVTISYQFDYRLIDGTGAPLGPWTTFASDSMNLASNQPQRFSYKTTVPLGRYEVRGYRTSNGGTDTKTSDVLIWNTLRAYLEEPNTYGGVTLLAVTMKATNTLTSQNSRKINVIATRKLQTWDPVNGWSIMTSTTRNPAWAFADIIRNPTYGRNLPDSRLNLPEIYRLAQVWDSRGDQFNGVFDTTSQLWDALSKVAKVGRALPMYYAGLVDIIRNEPKTLPVAMFSPANTVKNSFNSTYQFAEVDTPDHVVIEYDDEATWAPATVKCVLAGGTENTPANIQLFGCTNHDQAWREGITMAAINRDQRRLINLSTEMEGYLPKYGDLVQISHDVPAWGYSGRVMGFVPATGLVTCSEPIPFGGGATSFVIAFRKRDGSADGPYTITADPAGDPNSGIVHGTSSQLNAIYISDGIREELTFYQFGPTGRAGLLAQCMGAQPDDKENVQMTFVNYAPSIFLAETGGIVPPPDPNSNLPKPPVAPIIDKVTLEYSFSVGVQRIVATPANGAQYYEFRVSGDGGGNWINLGTSPDPFMGCALSPGMWIVQARGIGMIAGAWTSAVVNVEATTLPLVSLDVFTASTDALFSVILNWHIAAGNAGIAAQVELWHGLNNNLGNAVLLGRFPPVTTSFTHGNMGPGETHYYWARVIDQAGRQGPWFNTGVAVVGQSTSDTTKIIAQIGQSITESQLAQALVDKIDSGGGAAVEVDTLKTQLAAMYTIKTQLTVDGKTYIAGVGVGVENSGGIVQSQVLVAADRFAVITPNTAGAAQFPFIIQGGICYLQTAFIQDASITNAKIGNTIQSNAVNSYTGAPVWKIDKNGSIQFNGTTLGRLQMDNQALKVYDENGTLRVQLGNLSA